MTQDEIIRMAREAELYSYLWGGDINQQSLEALERFAALVAAHAKSEQINLAYQQGYEEGSAHEREACENAAYVWSAAAAKAIRARGEK